MMLQSSAVVLSRLDVTQALPVGAVEDVLAVDAAQIGGVFVTDGLVALDLLEEVAAAHATGRGDLRDHERLGAEGLGGALFGVHAQPLDWRPPP